jgi:DNA-binding response OmpR family regulator
MTAWKQEMPETSETRVRRVLIVEDEEPIRDLVRFHLDLVGYDCVTLGNGKDALEVLERDAFDLLVLDLGLPGVDGVTLCRAVRRQGPNHDVPILILTAKQEESDKVLGLESGADDYLTKPFGVHEFVARASALVRRREAWRPGSSTIARRIVGAKGLAIDPATRRVFRNDQEVHLTTQEFALIYMLASNPDIVFSRAEIIEKVWQPEIFVDDRVVDTLVKRLRRKVEDDPAQPKRVLTARGAGYKFAPVEEW